MKTLIPLMLALLLVACQSSYKTTVLADGTVQTEGTYDPKTEAPAFVLKPGPTTQPSITSGTTHHAPSGAELASDRAINLMWAGVGLLVLGGALWIAKAYIPLIPTTAGTYLVLTGAALIAASFILPSIPWWAWAAAAAVGAALVIPGLISNHKQLKPETSP